MDLQSYSTEEIFLAAIKSEIESKRVYSDLADMVKNVFLRERLRFLAQEEDKHHTLLEGEYMKHFPGNELLLPDKSPVPLPTLSIPDENVPISEVIDSAIKAELAASDFYLSMMKIFDPDDEIRFILEYFSKMEMGHYQILSQERENIARFEDYDIYWEMMNIGP